MFFGKSIAFGEKEFNDVALATEESLVRSAVEVEFIEKLKNGDSQAFDNLVLRYSADVYAILFHLTQDAEESADLTQETFLRALKAIRNFRGEAELKTWLVRIAINESRNRFRWWKRRRREKTVSLDAPAGENETVLSETVSSREVNPEESILQRERENRLKKALNSLPVNFREVVILCDIEGFSYEEIASVLEINIGTVKSRIARGRIELRRKLNDI